MIFEEQIDGETFLIDREDDCCFSLEKKGTNELIFIGVNPKNAEDFASDKTIQRLQGLIDWNFQNTPDKFDGFLVFNLCAKQTLPDDFDENLHEKNLQKIKNLILDKKNPTVLISFGDKIQKIPYLKKSFSEIARAFSAQNPNWVCVGKTKNENPINIFWVPFKEFEPFDVNFYFDDEESNESNDEFSLDIDDENEKEIDDEFSLDLEETQNDSEENAQNQKNGEGVNVDEFYSLVVEPFVRSRSHSLKMFILQGNVPAENIYRAVSLEIFATPTEKDSERISSLCDSWAHDAQKYERTDIEKYNEIKDAALTISAFFTNQNQNRELVENLQAVAWSHVSTLVKEKCEDGKVVLKEQVSLLKSVRSLGLFSSGNENAVRSRLREEIEKTGAKIETLESEFTSYFETFVSQSPVNALDTNENRLALSQRYKRLKQRADFIHGVENDWTDEKFLQELPNFLSSLSLSLLQPPLFFATDYFDSYSKNVDVSNLSEAEFAELRSTATGKYYKLTDLQWEEFVNAAGIKWNRSKNLDEEVSKTKTEYERRLAKANQIAEEEKNRAEKEKARVKNATRNALIRLCAIFLCLFGAVLIFKKLRPLQYASAVDSVVSIVAPSEEDKEQVRLAKENARLAQENAKSKSYTVGRGEKFDFSTISDAIFAAKDGDTIILSPGVYAENLSVSKSVKITGGEEAERAILSGYFSSKDVPILVVPKNISVKIASSAIFSALIFSQKESISFSSFQSYCDSAKMPPEKKFSDDPMSRDFSSFVRVSSSARFERVVFANVPQNAIAATAGDIQIEDCSFVNVAGSPIVAFAASNVSASRCAFLGVQNAVRSFDSSSVSVLNSSVKNAQRAFCAFGKSNLSVSNASVESYRLGAYFFSDESEGKVLGGTVSTAEQTGQRVAFEIGGFSTPKIDGVSVEGGRIGLWTDGRSFAEISNCNFFPTQKVSLTGAVFSDFAQGSILNCSFGAYPTGIIVQENASPQITKTSVSGGSENGVVFRDKSSGSFSGTVSGYKIALLAINKSNPAFNAVVSGGRREVFLAKFLDFCAEFSFKKTRFQRFQTPRFTDFRKRA